VARSGIKQCCVPEEFDLTIINQYLTSMIFEEGDEFVPSGTEKPAKRGRLLYLSDKIQLCQCRVPKLQIKSFSAQMWRQA
jgi:hypothetical protein